MPPNRFNPSSLTRSVAAASLMALACAACGSSGADATGSNAPEEFGLTLAQLTARVESTEQAIATCMRDAGFDYVAVDFPTIKKAMDSDQSAPGLSDEAYLKQFGLGITTQFDKPLVLFGAGPQNMTYLDQLAATDQVAFRRALWGEHDDWNHARALEEETFSATGGCTRRAAERTYASDELTSSYVNPADIRVEQDPRMVAAIKSWADCMRAEGHPYDHPDQVDADLRERLAAITAGQDPKTLSGPALEALKALQGEELAVAAVDKQCEEDHIEEVQTKVENDLFSGSST